MIIQNKEKKGDLDDLLDGMKESEVSNPAERVGYAETLKQLEDLKEVDVKRQGEIKPWSLRKMEMDCEGNRSLVVDFMESFSELEMKYKISVVLDPLNYNRNIATWISKFKDPQRNLFDNDQDYVLKVQNVHNTYSKDLDYFGIQDFVAEVSEYKRKTETKQVKFLIDNDHAAYFLENIKDMHKTALVLSKYF